MVVGRRWVYPAYVSSVLVLLLQSVACAQSARAIADTTFPSVVLLTMEDSKGRPISTASGFFIQEDLVVTNFHAVREGVTGHVKLVGSRGAYVIAGVASMDQGKDLAILRITGVKAPSLRLGSDRDARVGDRIYAAGNPMGLEGTFSDGIISAIRNTGSRRLLQITAPISPGSSGGPVLNEGGLVIGIAFGAFTKGQNLNFAIPVSDLAPLLANVGRLSPLPGRAAIAKPPSNVPTEGVAKPPPSISKGSKLEKATADVIEATKSYRLALERVLVVHERELARRQELATLRKDLYEKGTLTRRDFEDGQRAQAEAQKNVIDTRRAIEDADEMLREAISLAKSGRTKEAEELLKSRRGSKNVGTP
jgi:S1-C subfamily serine protease